MEMESVTLVTLISIMMASVMSNRRGDKRTKMGSPLMKITALGSITLTKVIVMEMVLGTPVTMKTPHS